MPGQLPTEADFELGGVVKSPPRKPLTAFNGPSLKTLLLRLCARIGYTPHAAVQL